MKSRGAGMLNGTGFNGDRPMRDGDTRNGFRGGPAGGMGNEKNRGGMNGWGAQQVNS